MAKSRNFGGILITLVVLAGIGYGSWVLYNKKSGGEPEYVTQVVARRGLKQTITASGNLSNMRTVDIGSQVSGMVIEVNADFNSKVKEGDILVRIDPSTYQQKLAQVEADMKSTEASFKRTMADYEVSKKLFESTPPLISKIDMDKAEASVIQAESSILSRKAALADARLNLERTIIRSPADGIVLNRFTDPGRTVNASTNTPNLFTIVNSLDKLLIDAGVSEADIGNITEGLPVEFTVDAFPGRPFNAKVTQVRHVPKNTGGVVTYSAMIDVDNTDQKLKPGMTANVAIIIASRPTNTLTLANSVLRTKIPPEILPKVKKADGTPAATTTGPVAPKAMTPEQTATAVQEILAQTGLSAGGTQTPEQIARAQELAKEKGIEPQLITNALAPQVAGRGGRGAGGGGGRGGGGAGGGGRGGRGGGVGPVAIGEGMNISSMPRKVYRLATDAAGKKYPEEVTVTLGISDGQYTEILPTPGLLVQEGDQLISYITLPGAKAEIKTAPTQGQANPFGGPQGGQRGGGGGPIGGGGGGGRGGGF